MSWTLSVSGHAIMKAGNGANENLTLSGSVLDTWSDQAEGKLNAMTRKDWVADYADVSTNFQGILDDTISDMVAMKIINYDMSGYTSRLEAQTMLDVLRDNIAKNIEILKEQKHKEEMD